MGLKVPVEYLKTDSAINIFCVAGKKFNQMNQVAKVPPTAGNFGHRRTSSCEVTDHNIRSTQNLLRSAQ